MELKEIVSGYATRTANGVEINLKAIARNQEFRTEVIKEVTKSLGSPAPCVVIPAYESGAAENHLGSLINELALTLQVKTLVTGDVKNFKRLKTHPKQVLIIKQSFRTGSGLQKQIAELKELGATEVRVLCFIAHNTGRMQGFGHENNVTIDALVKTDEMRYLQ